MAINAHEYTFPVIGASAKVIKTEKVFFTKTVYGSAFSIGKDYFLTAGHVLKNAGESEAVGIGFSDQKMWHFAEVTNSEIISDYDIGIIQAKVPVARALRWKYGDELPMLSNVQTVGYPYALDLKRFTIDTRAFKGHIVVARTFMGLKSNPRIYELSFQAPRGLSGSPLFTVGKRPNIIGMIIGNHRTEMLVFSDKERIVEGDKKITTIVERYEALQLGIAIQTMTLVKAHSHILGDSLFNHLKKTGLLK